MVVGDKEGVRVGDTPPPSSSASIPPDHLRCHRSDGKKWRCKGWKFDSSLYCEKHYTLFLKTGRLKPKPKPRADNNATTTEHNHHHHHHHQVNQKLPKRRRYIDFTSTSTDEDSDSDSDDDQDFTPRKKSRNDSKDSDNKEMENYNISELVIYLKSSFRKQEFGNVEKTLQMREDKMKREKEEAEKQAAQLEEDLGIFETMCGLLTSEVEEKKKEIFEVNDTLLEKEIKNFDIQDKLQKCKKINNELEDKVGRLEKELEIVGVRERRSEERFTKMSWDIRERISELERKNRDLETDKRRAEGGTEVRKRRFELEQSETQLLLEPQASRKIYAEPRGSPSNVSCSNEGATDSSRNRACLSNGNTGKEDTEHDRGFCAPANPDSISQSLTRARVPDEAKKCENKQTKTQSETSCALTGAGFPNLKETLNCGGRIYASTKVDLDCCSPSGENRVVQPAGVTKKSESKQIKFQNEATHALEGATLSQIKIKEEALNCDQKLCTSPILDSICHSARSKNSQESPLSRQKSISPLVSEEKNRNEVRHTRFESEASCALNGAKFCQVKIEKEPLNCNERFSASSVDSASLSIRSDNIKDASNSRSRSVLLQQFEQKRSVAEQIFPKQFEIIGTSCKQSRNSTAENDSEKDTKELGADCDGISAFLCELRRLKANKLNLT